MIAVVVDIITYKCPNLKALAIGEVASTNHNDKWSMKTLEQFQDTIKITKTLGMVKVYYSGSERSLLLTHPHVDKPEGGKQVGLVRVLAMK